LDSQNVNKYTLVHLHVTKLFRADVHGLYIIIIIGFLCYCGVIVILFSDCSKHLLDNEGKPQMFAGIITHLHYHDPGNLAFVYLLRSGALRRICKREADGTISKETQMNLVIVLSYLFAPLILHKRAEGVKYTNSKVVLPPLPLEIKKVITSNLNVQ